MFAARQSPSRSSRSTPWSLPSTTRKPPSTSFAMHFGLLLAVCPCRRSTPCSRVFVLSSPPNFSRASSAYYLSCELHLIESVRHLTIGRHEKSDERKLELIQAVALRAERTVSSLSSSAPALRRPAPRSPC
eukprot:6200835-Pleurochrysis_carterae.AAC.1